MKKVLSRVLAMVICLAMVMDSQAVSVWASEIAETFLENDDLIIEREKDSLLSDTDAEEFNDDMLILQEDVLDEPSSIKEITNDVEVTADKMSTDGTGPEEMLDEVEAMMADMSSADATFADDFQSKYGLTYEDLIYKCPQYLDNKQMEYYLEKRFDYAGDVWDDVVKNKKKTAQILDNMKKGISYNAYDLISEGQLSNLEHQEFQKEMARQVVYDYLRSEDGSATLIKEISSNLSKAKKVYSKTEYIAEFSADFAEYTNWLSAKQIENICKELKKCDEVKPYIDDTNKFLGIALSIVAADELSMDAVNVLIEAQEINKTDNDLYEGLLLLKSEMNDPVTFAISNFVVKEFINNVTSAIDEMIFTVAFPVGGTTLYAILTSSIKIISAAWEWKNPSYSEIEQATITFMYYKNASTTVNFLQRRLKRGTNQLRYMIIYEAAYETKLSCLRVFMKRVMACTSNKQITEKLKSYYGDISNDIHSDGMYALYINLCMKEASEALKAGTIEWKDTKLIRKTDNGKVIDENYDSTESITKRFAVIQNQYKPNVGQTWTGNWGGCIQCFGFARMVFSKLFDCEMPWAYSSTKPYLYPSEDNVTLIGQLEGSNVTSSSVKTLLSRGRLGDVIQASGSVYGQHTMIFVGAGDSYVKVYDCNSAVNGGTAGSCNINEWNIPYDSFANWYGSGDNCGVSLYEADNYSEIYGDGENLFYDDTVNFVIEDGVLKKYNGWQRNVVIPEGVTVIGANAFKNNTSMYSVYIPNSVTRIEDNAFYGCKALVSVDIPDSVSYIGKFAFGDCSNLRSAFLPYNDDFKEINGGVFANCVSLHTVNIPKNWGCDSDVAWYGKGNSPFYNCSSLEVVTFEEGIIQISNALFQDCIGLKSIIIPDTVTTIKRGAFLNASSLESIKLSNGLTALHQSCFQDCKSLTSVTVPDTVVEIGSYAFSGCKNLKEIHLSSKLSSINAGLFLNCIALERVNIPKTCCRDVEVSFFADGPFKGCDENLHIEFEQGITELPNCIFQDYSALKSFVVPETVVVIYCGAFSNATGLESVVLPSRLTTIGNDSFKGCTSLHSLDIPDSVSQIGAHAFGGCKSLKNVHLPVKLMSLSAGLFLNCESLENVNVPKSSCRNTSVSFYGDGPFEGCTEKLKIEFETGVTEIPNCIFQDCAGIKKITIPDTVTVINQGAFLRATNLEEVTLSAQLEKIYNESFSGCTSLREINIPNTVTGMGSNVFYNCSSLSKVHLPESRVNIMPYTFYGCTNLEEINLPDSLQTIQQYSFYNCDGLKEIILPDNITTIGSNAFQDCDKLETFSMGNKVSSVGTYCFDHCDMLKSITLSNALKTIPAQSLSNCAILEEIKVPYNVSTISSKAFMNDSKLGKITIPRNTTSITADAFSYPLTIYGVAGTYAETYANANGHTFVNKETNATALEVLPENPVVNKNGQLQLVFNITPADFTDAITCKSSDTDILTVDNTGLVKGIKVGEASVKITIGSITKTVDIKVKQPVTDIYVSPYSVTLNGGETAKLTADVYPDDAANKDYIWESEDEAIATVDENGLVTAVSKGTVKINAKAQDGSEVVGYCTVTVSSNLYKVNTLDDFQSPHNYELNCSDIWEYTKENAENIAITFSDDTEVEDKFDYIYIYDKDNKEIGKYTGKQLAGKTVTVKGSVVRVKLVSDDNGALYGFRVVSIEEDVKNVPLKGITLSKTSLTLGMGDMSRLDIVYDPKNATVEGVAGWTSSNDKVAVVDNGLVQAVGVGTAVITAELDGKTATCNVTVTESISSISLSPSDIKLYVGQSGAINVRTNTGFIPADGVNVTSSNSSVASISFDAGNGLIRVEGLTAGETVIKVEINEQEASATVRVVTPSIIFKDQDGSNLGIEPISAVYGKKYSQLPVPVKDDSVFGGWYSGPDCSGVLIDSNTVFEGIETLYAAWIHDDAKLRVMVSEEYKYTGEKICPEVKIYDGASRLVPKDDYSVSYKNNVNVYTLAEGDSGFNANLAPSITIKGSGNYEQTDVVYFKILPNDISGEDFSADNMALVASNKEQKVSPILYYKGKALKPGKDYKFSIYKSTDTSRSNPVGLTVKDAGSYIICLKGEENYTGTRDISLTVTSNTKLVSKLSIGKIGSVAYTGKPIIPEPSVMDGKTVLENGKHYTLSYDSNTAVGTGYVIVNGISANGYTGSKRVSFKITGPKAGKAKVYDISPVKDLENRITLSCDKVVPFMKGGVQPAVTVTYKEDDDSVITLVEGTDYKLSYKNNKAYGGNKAPTIIVSGKGEFKGKRECTFAIEEKSLDKVTLLADDVLFKDKANSYTTKVVLLDEDGKNLKAGKDYEKVLTYVYVNETEVTVNGSKVVKAADSIVDKQDIIPVNTVIRVTATAKAGSGYTETVSGTYKIMERSIASAKVSIPVQTYTGKPITLSKNSIEVAVKGKKLADTDYEIVGYSNNKNKGTAKVTLRGIGNYGGLKTQTFKIKAKGFRWWWK